MATPYSTIKLSTEHYLWEQNASLSLSLSVMYLPPSAIRRNLGNSSVAPPFIPSFKSTYLRRPPLIEAHLCSLREASGPRGWTRG